MTPYLPVDLQSTVESAAECDSSSPTLIFPRINDISLKKKQKTNTKHPPPQKQTRKKRKKKPKT